MVTVLAVIYSKYEIPFCEIVCANLCGKTIERQYLAGSFSGALSSQKVTEECIKVG